MNMRELSPEEKADFIGDLMTKDTQVFALTLGAGALLYFVAKNSTPPVSSGVNEGAVAKLAHAIAKQEGFFISGSVAARNHNPGNLTEDIFDFGTPAKAIGRAGAFMVYANDTDGWEDLRNQLRLALSGRSRIYKPSMTLREFGFIYTKTQQDEWVNNVSAQLGVSPLTRLSTLV